MLVMARGRLSPSIATADATVELIGEWMSGLWPGHEHTEHTEEHPDLERATC
jgi:hypothetical protein